MERDNAERDARQNETKVSGMNIPSRSFLSFACCLLLVSVSIDCVDGSENVI